ncbi:MAG: glycosyl transferase, partial [Parcubacteria group bacterium CG10_big_fil_rev_8_21_14_0_10_41_35]
FGLVMIESMACGTPVIAFNKGAVPEIVKHGITGYVVKNEKQMIGAVKKIYSMKEDEYIKMRYACREHVEKNFSVEKMVDNYEKLYYKIIEQHKNK